MPNTTRPPFSGKPSPSGHQSADRLDVEHEPPGTERVHADDQEQHDVAKPRAAVDLVEDVHQQTAQWRRDSLRQDQRLVDTGGGIRFEFISL